MKIEMKYVILSSPLIIGIGTFRAVKLTQEQAKKWVKSNNPVNYCGHQTVKLVGLEPATDRKECTDYDSALVIQPLKRLDFGKEYSVEEIEEIGVTYTLIARLY